VKLPPFQFLVDEHGSGVFKFLVASVGLPEASDLFQETMLAALSGYERLRDDSNLKGWLFTIAHHKVIDFARGGQRRPVPVASTPELRVTPYGERLEEDGGLWEAVARLPERQRAAVTLRYVGDMSYASIAEVLGATANAARQNVHKGLTTLRKELGDDRSGE